MISKPQRVVFHWVQHTGCEQFDFCFFAATMSIGMAGL